MINNKAKITEVFSSIQGEGICLGVKQIFIRFSGCNTDCVYCDEKKKTKTSIFSAQQLLNRIKRLNKRYGRHQWVSLTGGEPLIHSGFLKAFLPQLKKKGFKVYLETNGTLPEALNSLKKHFDIISMDIKLPSSTRQNGFWKKHHEFLKLGKNKIFVKIVVTPGTDKKDLRRAINMVKDIDPRITFILQPATKDKSLHISTLKNTVKLADLASKDLRDIRIIPQVHKMMGIR